MRSRLPPVARLLALPLALLAPALAAAQPPPEPAPAPSPLTPFAPPPPEARPIPQIAPLLNATPAEQPLRTPIPVYVELPEDATASATRVWLRYQPIASDGYQRVALPALGRGFGVELPCDLAAAEGPVRYYIELEDAEGAPVGAVATAADPLTILVVSNFDGEPPALPGHLPPAACPAPPPAVPPPPEPARFQVALLGTADSMVFAQGDTAGFTAARAVLSCERWLWKTVPFTAGVRLGYAFDGGPTGDPRTLSDERGISVEGRVTGHPLGLWGARTVDPFFFIGGGISRARTPPPRTLGGPGFVSTGFGATFSLGGGLGLTAEISLLLYVPELAFVVAPSAGPTFRF